MKLIKRLFRKRIERLHPIVGFNEHAEVIYGRYDVFDGNKDDLVHGIVDHTGTFTECFSVKKISELEYQKYCKMFGKK